MNDAPEDLVREAIEGAEEIVGPLDDLVARTTADPGAPFTPDVIDALRSLRQEDLAAFETLRSELKKAGCRMTALDQAMTDASDDGSGRGPSQADVLIQLAAGAELFHTSDGGAFADVMVNGHRETWPVRTKGFRRWLIKRYFETTGGAPNADAMQAALNVIDAKAHFDGPERTVCIRVASLDDNFYLDLVDDRWRAIEISSGGWQVVDAPPVRFRRTAGMQPLPVPAAGGPIEMLRRFLNVRTDRDFTLIVAWALAVLRDHGPYPVLVLSGEQGSAKSTFSSILRALLDPNTAPLRALPREDRDLFIAANNGHILAFDNISGLPAWISDTLCRLATGGGFAVRQLYTDQDEVLFDATRPAILNGIEDIVSRPDLADRAIFLNLESIPDAERRPEKQLWAEFNAVRPQILGTLLDAVVRGINQLPTTRLEGLPRMADFALWATACETALWASGTFSAAYAGNRDEAVDNVIESDVVGSAIRALMVTTTEWTGTSSDLLEALSEYVSEKMRKTKAWPSSPRAMSGRVTRAATFLRKVGIDIDRSRIGRAGARTIRMTRIADRPTESASELSAPSATSIEPSSEPVPEPESTLTVDEPTDASDMADWPTVSNKQLKNNETDGADGTDADPQPESGNWKMRL